MIPHTCIVKHDPPNSYGDCLRACIASMFNFADMELVPHFYRDGDDERGNAEFKNWLRDTFNLRPFYMALQNVSIEAVFEMMAGVNTDVEYLLFHTSVDADHVVICRNDKVLHNPAWYRSPVTGPASNGYYVIMVVVPINP